MTRNELRYKLLAGIDKILKYGTWVLGAEEIRIIKAQRALYIDDDEVVDRLLAKLAFSDQASELSVMKSHFDEMEAADASSKVSLKDVVEAIDSLRQSMVDVLRR